MKIPVPPLLPLLVANSQGLNFACDTIWYSLFNTNTSQIKICHSVMQCETSSETTSHRDSLSLINHSFVQLQFKQDSFKLTVSLSTRKSWPTWTIKDNVAQSSVKFKVGFLPRASSRLCSGTDKMWVLPHGDGVGDLVLHLCGQHRSGCWGRGWIPGGAVAGRTG